MLSYKAYNEIIKRWMRTYNKVTLLELVILKFLMSESRLLFLKSQVSANFLTSKMMVRRFYCGATVVDRESSARIE